MFCPPPQLQGQTLIFIYISSLDYSPVDPNIHSLSMYVPQGSSKKNPEKQNLSFSITARRDFSFFLP